MRHRARTLVITMSALSALLGSSVVSAGAATPPASAVAGASWLSSHMTAEGYVETVPNVPDLGDTAQTVEALAAVGGHAGAVARGTTYLEAHARRYIDGTATASAENDKAGSLAELIILSQITGTTSGFDATSLVKRLVATQRPDGLFGETPVTDPPTYDGTTRQSLSLEALSLEGQTTSNSSAVSSGLTWLLAQQCPDGGFASDAASPEVGCVSKPAEYLGPDTNSTAAAVQALVVLHQPRTPGSPLARAEAFLASVERPTGGWGYEPTNAADCDSTAVVIEALVVLGQNPKASTGEWAKGGISPNKFLAEFQDTNVGSNFGGFRYQNTSLTPYPDVISTEQAVYALSGDVVGS